MLIKNLTFLLSAALANGFALNYSPVPIDLDVATLESRDHGCAVPGVVNGECGRYYRSTGCEDQIAAIGPGECSSQCYSSLDEISSIHVSGDGTYGVNCHLYYDSNCQSQIGESGNIIVGSGKCYTPGNGAKGHSMLCWYKC
ncbi:hypothetical protein ONZ43_g5653 [Nemania bipapillata]|uniref:Uncharacterized protein n=1 Tax=Nemania bipapillata TaxID=110536 RepID=A0ACC2I848_9PEZI|nr:hypothetical protein ONZ43_g5653 [Nemania bipapillata]